MGTDNRGTSPTSPPYAEVVVLCFLLIIGSVTAQLISELASRYDTLDLLCVFAAIAMGARTAAILFDRAKVRRINDRVRGVEGLVMSSLMIALSITLVWMLKSRGG